MNYFWLKYFLGYLSILLSVSIGYYTIYGLNKSAIEYFCIQKRGGSIVYSEYTQIDSIDIRDFNFLNNHPVIGDYNRMTLTPSDLKFATISMGKNQSFYSYYDYCKTDYSISYNEGDVSLNCKKDKPGLLINYKLNEEYFELSCNIENYQVNNKTLVISGNKRYLTIKNKNEMAYNPFMTYNCLFEKRLETCQMKQSLQDKFFQFYWISVLFSFFLMLLSFITYKQKTFLRNIFFVLECFDFKNIGVRPFCNPLTGKPVKIGKGEYYCIISDTEEFANNQRKLNSSFKTQNLNDKKGCYEINDVGILVIVDDSRRLIKMDESKRVMISEYFGLIKEYPEMCASDGKHHYYETSYVLEQISIGKFLKFEMNEGEDKFFMDVSRFDFNFLNEKFSLTEEVSKILLEHNKLFFKIEHVLFEPLFNCLKGNYHHYYRPKYVNNSTWKWYGSDVKLIMNSFGIFGFKSQVNWRESYSLISARVKNIKIIDDEDKEVCLMLDNKKLSQDSLKKFLSLEMKDLKDKFENKMKEVDLPIGEDKRYKFRYNKENDSADVIEYVHSQSLPIIVEKAEETKLMNFKNIDSCKEEVVRVKEELDRFLKTTEKVTKPYLEAIKSNIKVTVEVNKVLRDKKEQKYLLYLDRKNKIEELSSLANLEEREEKFKYKISKTTNYNHKYHDHIIWHTNVLGMKEAYCNLRNYYQCLENYKEEEYNFEFSASELKLKNTDLKSFFSKRGKYKQFKKVKPFKRLVRKSKKLPTKNKHYNKYFLICAGFKDFISDKPIGDKNDCKNANCDPLTSFKKSMLSDTKKSFCIDEMNRKILKCRISLLNFHIKNFQYENNHKIRNNFNRHFMEKEILDKMWENDYPILDELLKMTQFKDYKR